MSTRSVSHHSTSECLLPIGVSQAHTGCRETLHTAFFADVLGFDSVDAGGGWLIFGLPPAELAMHPAETASAELYFMCDDLTTEMRRLAEKGIKCSEVEEARWGSVTKIRLPGGGSVGLYTPRHAAMVEHS